MVELLLQDEFKRLQTQFDETLARLKQAEEFEERCELVVELQKLVKHSGYLISQSKKPLAEIEQNL